MGRSWILFYKALCEWVACQGETWRKICRVLGEGDVGVQMNWKQGEFCYQWAGSAPSCTGQTSPWCLWKVPALSPHQMPPPCCWGQLGAESSPCGAGAVPCQQHCRAGGWLQAACAAASGCRVFLPYFQPHSAFLPIPPHCSLAIEKKKIQGKDQLSFYHLPVRQVKVCNL